MDLGNELSLLGGFLFSIEGDAILGISAGSQRLLAFLAVRDQTMTRQRVAGTLWPESTDEHAGASLRAAVARLGEQTRQAVRVTARDLGLADGLVVDVHYSRALAHRLIDSGELDNDGDIDRGAVAALSSDLLPGWYEDWAVLAAEDWHQLRVHALEAVADRLRSADRLAEAASAALAAVQAEPLRESARAALVRVHLAEGNHSAALDEFERYRVLLHADLALEPTSRLRNLLDDLLQRQEAGPPSTG
ncbi:MAG: family transcriptional regulator, regulator of embCAB operon [Actinomycetota bacterium]|jgi:DNA-binding SARP family transcriptional activator|nr:family transcriptional regulator, regulator of embCAB operon [Actinomycetota bacterium]